MTRYLLFFQNISLSRLGFYPSACYSSTEERVYITDQYKNFGLGIPSDRFFKEAVSLENTPYIYLKDQNPMESRSFWVDIRCTI